MLSPKKVKFRKMQRGRMKGRAKGGDSLCFGDYGLQAVECGYVNARQIEAARVAMNRKVKRGGKMWIKFFPDKPVTKKPAEVRMGKGKGPTDQWVAVIKPGKVLYEIEGVPRELAMEALRLASHKLSVKTRFIERNQVV